MHRTQVEYDSSDPRAPMPTESSEPFREETRVPLVAPVRIKFDGFGEMQAGFTANVSRGGMFVRGTEHHPVGTLLEFELDRSSTAVVGLGEVVWIRLKQRDQQQPPGMGIQFRYLDVESLSLLDAAVQKAVVDLSVPEEPVGRSCQEVGAPTRCRPHG